jgi:hypothetical protein
MFVGFYTPSPIRERWIDVVAETHASRISEMKMKTLVARVFGGNEFPNGRQL